MVESLRGMRRSKGVTASIAQSRLVNARRCFNQSMRQLVVVLALALVGCIGSVRAFDSGPEGNPPWPASALVEPKAFADMLSGNPGSRPVVIYVGFPSLYNGAHIRNSILAGPASKPEALDQLRQVVKLLPRNKQLAIYCGCCPFGHCPNIRPAYAYLRNMGFKDIKVLHIPENLHTDWVVKGYPTTRSASE